MNRSTKLLLSLFSPGCSKRTNQSTIQWTIGQARIFFFFTSLYFLFRPEAPEALQEWKKEFVLISNASVSRYWNYSLFLLSCSVAQLLSLSILFLVLYPAVQLSRARVDTLNTTSNLVQQLSNHTFTLPFPRDLQLFTMETTTTREKKAPPPDRPISKNQQPNFSKSKLREIRERECVLLF